MELDANAAQNLVHLVQQRFPGWANVDDLSFFDDEVGYKRNAAAKVQEMLDKETLKALLDTQQFDEVISRFDQAGKATNLLYRSTPRTGDLRLLYQDEVEASVLAPALFDFIHGDGDQEARLERFLTFSIKHSLPLTWAFSTYFPFLLNPSQEYFVKPTPTKWFLETFAGKSDFPWSPKNEPAVDARWYTDVRQIFHQLREMLAPYGARDMIDVQSMVYVAYKENDEIDGATVSIAPPFDAIFTDREQAVWAFDRFRETIERLGGGPDDTDSRFALTLPQNPPKMRLNMGNWAIFDVRDNGQNVRLSLLAEPTAAQFDFADVHQFAEDSRVRQFLIPAQVVQEWPSGLATIYADSMRHIAEHFANHSVSVYRRHHQPELFQALFDEQARDKLLSEGFRPIRYWRITLPSDRPATTLDGKNSNTWDVCLKHGIAAIDFGREADHPQVEKFASIQPGDRVVAFLRNKQIGGIGTVTSTMDMAVAENKPAGQDYFGGEMWYRIDVDWTPVDVRVSDLPKSAADKFGQQTVLEIDEDVYEEVLNLISPAPPPTIAKEFQGFTADAFDFLRELEQNNNKAWMEANEERWIGAVREPMRRLFADLGPRVKAAFDAYLSPDELEITPDARHTLARISKNWTATPDSQYYTYYWGAFYRVGKTKQTDAQLFVNIHSGHIRFGFFVGEQADQVRKQFRDRVSSYPDAFLSLIKQTGLTDDFQFIRTDGSRQTMTTVNSPEDLLTWVANGDFDVLMYRAGDEAVRLGPALADQVLDALRRVFPVFLWAVAEDYEATVERYLDDVFPPPEDPLPRPYNESDFLARTHLLPETLADLRAMAEDRGQVIFYGPPGTGKTYVARELGKLLTGLADPPPERLEMIQFHPAYSYEDFIEGIRPKTTEIGDHHVISYPTQAGVFRRFCERAAAIDGTCVFVIDEINRGNMARIFGELMLLLEYRDASVPLPYSGRRFIIPRNVILIGTMNTADRSIALVDFALRRRFHFFQFGADPRLFDRWLESNGAALPYLSELYRRLANEAIDDPSYAIGPSYFMKKGLTEAQLRRIWEYSILPQLREYYFDQQAKYELWEWDSDLMKGLRGMVDGD